VVVPLPPHNHNSNNNINNKKTTMTTTTMTSVAASASGSGSSSASSTNDRATIIDVDYPGTAVERLNNVRARVAELMNNEVNGNVLNGPWQDVRRQLLWAGGLRDLPNAQPGQGYTGHAFNDYNHVDLTCMLDNVSDSENDGAIKGIAIGNRLGNGIRIASLPELGPGGRQVVGVV
jgi:hypothetical protein